MSKIVGYLINESKTKGATISDITPPIYIAPGEVVKCSSEIAEKIKKSKRFQAYCKISEPFIFYKTKEEAEKELKKKNEQKKEKTTTNDEVKIVQQSTSFVAVAKKDEVKDDKLTKKNMPINEVVETEHETFSVKQKKDQVTNEPGAKEAEIKQSDSSIILQAAEDKEPEENKTMVVDDKTASQKVGDNANNATKKTAKTKEQNVKKSSSKTIKQAGKKNDNKKVVKK